MLDQILGSKADIDRVGRRVSSIEVDRFVSISPDVPEAVDRALALGMTAVGPTGFAEWPSTSGPAL